MRVRERMVKVERISFEVWKIETDRPSSLFRWRPLRRETRQNNKANIYEYTAFQGPLECFIAMKKIKEWRCSTSGHLRGSQKNLPDVHYKWPIMNASFSSIHGSLAAPPNPSKQQLWTKNCPRTQLKHTLDRQHRRPIDLQNVLKPYSDCTITQWKRNEQTENNALKMKTKQCSNSQSRSLTIETPIGKTPTM